MLFHRICLLPIAFLLWAVDGISQKKDSTVFEALVPQRFHDQARNHPAICIIRGVQNQQKELAITFDDGPALVSSRIFDVLKKHNAKATFFWLGSNLSEHKDMLKRAINEGHQIGNHSWDHQNMWNSPVEHMWVHQVEKTNLEFERLTGGKLELYRPPFGAVNDKQIRYLQKRGMKTILWSISTEDWNGQKNSSDEITSKVMDNLHRGAIVLMHDFDAIDNPDAGVDREGMLNALDQILIECKGKGYSFVTISELINSNEKN